MRILGIDPGYGITGFGLIEADRGICRLLRCGAITTPPNTDFSWRLGEIYNHMNHAADKGDFSADILLDIVVKL